MIILLSPQRRDDTLTVVVSGDEIVLNGEVYDFSPLPEGGALPSDAVGSEWLIGDITRKNGEIELTLILPNRMDASYEARFPVPINVTNDGLVELPV